MRLFMQVTAGVILCNALLLAVFRIARVHGMKITFWMQKINRIVHLKVNGI